MSCIFPTILNHPASSVCLAQEWQEWLRWIFPFRQVLSAASNRWQLLPLWFNQLTGILHEIKTIRKMGLKKKCWDILCRHILPLMQKQNVLWLFVHTGQFRSSTATNFLAMTSHTWESTSNLQCSDGNFLPWRLVVTSSSATRIHDSLLRAAMGCRSCLGVSWGKFQLLPVFRIEDWTIFIHIWPPWPFFFIVRCRTTLPQPPGNGEGLNIHDPCRTVSTTVIWSQINLQLCSQTILFAIQSLDSLVQSDHELILTTFCMLY